MNCPCSFDLCEFINVFLGGFLVAILASIAIAWFLRRRKRKRYGKIEGSFDGYAPGAFGELISSASVKYISWNSLEIQVMELKTNYVWTGFISCYSDKLGKIEWLYTFPEVLSQRFGIKKIQIQDKNNFLVIGDIEAGFGNERFQRAPIPNETTLQFIARILRYYFDV